MKKKMFQRIQVKNKKGNGYRKESSKDINGSTKAYKEQQPMVAKKVKKMILMSKRTMNNLFI